MYHLDVLCRMASVRKVVAWGRREDLQKINKDVNSVFSNHINASCKSNTFDCCHFIFISFPS